MQRQRQLPLLDRRPRDPPIPNVNQAQLRHLEGGIPITNKRLLRERQRANEKAVKKVVEGCTLLHADSWNIFDPEDDDEWSEEFESAPNSNGLPPRLRRSIERHHRSGARNGMRMPANIERWIRMRERPVGHLSERDIRLARGVRRIQLASTNHARAIDSSYDSDDTDATDDDEDHSATRAVPENRQKRRGEEGERTQYATSIKFVRILQKYSIHSPPVSKMYKD